MAEKFLPRVRVNVTEVVNQANTPVTYTPAFILRAPTGPIGERNYYRTYADFTAVYGDPSQFLTEDFPVFYALGEYLKTYQGIYVTRLASDDASYGSIEGGIILKDSTGIPRQDISEDVKLVSVVTKYKTDNYNGLEVAIKTDPVSSVIYGSVTIGGTTYETTRYKVDFGTLSNVQFESILNNIADSFNELDLGLIMTNEYTSAYSVVPAIDDIMTGVITGGSAGSNTVENDVVKEAIKLYDSVEIAIDSITFPEFENLEVINYVTPIAENRMFFVLSTAHIQETYDNTVTAVSDSEYGYVAGDTFTFTVGDNIYTGEVKNVEQTPYIIETNYPASSLYNYEGTYETVATSGEGVGLQIMINTDKVEDPKPTVSDIESLISEYPRSKALVVYLDEVNYTEGYYVDPVTGKNVYMDIPASVAVQHAYAKSYLSGPYRAPAGISRATLDLVKGLKHNWSETELAILNNYSIPVNPILFKPSYGYVVWDEKTTANEKDNPYSKYVNGAALVNYLVKNLDQMSQRYLFEPITATTFANWELEATNIVDPLVNESVIYPSYTVTMDSTNNNAETIARNELHGSVVVHKIGVAREITIDLEVSNSLDEEEITE